MEYSSFLELQRWVNRTDNRLGTGNGIPPYNKIDIMQIKELIREFAEQIRMEYPVHSMQLLHIAEKLFCFRLGGGYTLNTCLFGGLYFIVKQVECEKQNAFWSNIHSRILKVSQALYADGYYDSAAEKALREVETYMRELYAELKPGKGDPREISNIKEALLSDNAIYAFDHSTISGQNYYKGVKQLFDVAFLTYRNPAAHRNMDIVKRQAFERIALASQLMYILDERN